MTIDLRHARVQLSSRQPLTLADARGSRLRALAGTAWVTMDGDSRDWVLEAGDELQLASDRRVLVMALGPAQATMELCTRRDRPGGWRARIAQALTRHAPARPAAAAVA